MTVHRDREGGYICCGGRGGQEEGSCSKNIYSKENTCKFSQTLSKYSVKSYACDPSEVFTARFNYCMKISQSNTEHEFNKMHTEMLSNVSKIREYLSSQQLSSYCHFSLTAFKILSETS